MVKEYDQHNPKKTLDAVFQDRKSSIEVQALCKGICQDPEEPERTLWWKDPELAGDFW